MNKKVESAVKRAARKAQESFNGAAFVFGGDPTEAHLEALVREARELQQVWKAYTRTR